MLFISPLKLSQKPEKPLQVNLHLQLNDLVPKEYIKALFQPSDENTSARIIAPLNTAQIKQKHPFSKYLQSFRTLLLVGTDRANYPYRKR